MHSVSMHIRRTTGTPRLQWKSITDADGKKKIMIIFKRTCQIVEFAVPTDHSIKMKKKVKKKNNTEALLEN